MNLLLLSVVLTNLVTTIQIPIVPYNDRAAMYGYFQGDGTNSYGIKIEGLDIFTNSVVSSWVGEKYVPPVSESVIIALMPNVVAVRCTVLGPHAEKVFSKGRFELRIDQPKLYIDKDKKITWFDPYGCWYLEQVTGFDFPVFRLKRNLEWRIMDERVVR